MDTNNNTNKKCCSNNKINNSSNSSNNNDSNLRTTTTATDQTTSFYKRELPSHLIEFSSEEGKTIFKEALTNGNMESYFSLAEQFLSQSDPAFCGLATLSMVLNALKIDPNRLWKGPWRWFVDDMLDCCIPIETVRKRGITFTEFSCLAKCNGASIRSYRGDETLDLDQFRQDIIKVSSNKLIDYPIHLVMSYSRKTLGQTGSGHYSPIGGYHKERDLALLLDVARFKYAPHWVPVEILYESMKLIDEDTNKPRGYFIISKNQSFSPSFYQIKVTLKWSDTIQKYLSNIRDILNNSTFKDYRDIIEILFKHLPTETPYILCAYSCELQKQLNNNENSSTTNNNSNNSINKGCCKINNNEHNSSININKWESFFQEFSTNSKSYPVLKEMVEEGKIHWKMSSENDSSRSEYSESEKKEIKLCSNYQIQIATFLFLSFPNSIFNSLINQDSNINFNKEILDKITEIRSLNSLDRNIKDEVLKAREELFLEKLDDECECSVSCKL